MGRLVVALIDKSGPEIGLMAHMFESLAMIFRGGISGIEAAVHDHLLDDMCEYMRVYYDGNCALREAVVFLSHKRPDFKILEVGKGTGNATREVLRIHGDRLYISC